MSKVIITRPLEQAQTLAQALAATGREAVVFPLLEISPLPDDSQLRAELHRLTQYALVIFVSPNAIHHAFKHIEQWPASVAIGIIGESSRGALQAHGAIDARIHAPASLDVTDSEGLLAALDLNALAEKNVLIIRGESGREFLSDSLRARHILVTQVAAYRRTAPLLDAARQAQLQSLLASPNDWIITSSEALRFLLADIEQCQLDAARFKARHRLFIPHQRIAHNAKTLGFQNIVMSSSGDENILAALQCRP